MKIRNPDAASWETHFCSSLCFENQKPCDLCEAQRRKRRDEELLAAGKPTLQYNPFQDLLRKKS